MSRFLCALFGLSVGASAVAAQATMAPVNDRPNPYVTQEGWAKMPAGRTWGATSAVAIDRDGVTLVEQLFSNHLQSGGAIIFSSHQAVDLPGVKYLALAGS